MHTIYAISHRNMTYIGRTERTIEQRMTAHRYRLNSNRNNRTKLYLAMEKYGFEKFKIEAIATCKTREQAVAKERELIMERGNLNLSGRGRGVTAKFWNDTWALRHGQ